MTLGLLNFRLITHITISSLYYFVWHVDYHSQSMTFYGAMALGRTRDDSINGAAQSRSNGRRGGRDRHVCIGIASVLVMTKCACAPYPNPLFIEKFVHP
jgi:hypothetical protein